MCKITSAPIGTWNYTSQTDQPTNWPTDRYRPGQREISILKRARIRGLGGGVLGGERLKHSQKWISMVYVLINSDFIFFIDA